MEQDETCSQNPERKLKNVLKYRRATGTGAKENSLTGKVICMIGSAYLKADRRDESEEDDFSVAAADAVKLVFMFHNDPRTRTEVQMHFENI